MSIEQKPLVLKFVDNCLENSYMDRDLTKETGAAIAGSVGAITAAYATGLTSPYGSENTTTTEHKAGTTNADHNLSTTGVIEGFSATIFSTVFAGFAVYRFAASRYKKIDTATADAAAEAALIKRLPDEDFIEWQLASDELQPSDK